MEKSGIPGLAIAVVDDQDGLVAQVPTKGAWTLYPIIGTYQDIARQVFVLSGIPSRIMREAQWNRHCLS